MTAKNDKHLSGRTPIRERPSRLAVDATARAAAAQVPVTCDICGQLIEGVVVVALGLHQNEVTRGRERPRCEDCYAEAQERQDRWEFKRWPDARWTLNPDAEGYDPFDSWRVRLHPCAYCGRLIRGHPTCSGYCHQEAKKATRRKEPKEQTCQVCGKSFTPRRSDAKTCSDRCRQRLRRSRIAVRAEPRRAAPPIT